MTDHEEIDQEDLDSLKAAESANEVDRLYKKFFVKYKLFDASHKIKDHLMEATRKAHERHMSTDRVKEPTELSEASTKPPKHFKLHKNEKGPKDI